MKKTILKLVLICLIVVFVLHALISTLNNLNTFGRVSRCEYNLKDIWQYIEQYRDDWDGSFPQSLSQLALYSPLPNCPGDRNRDETSHSWDYCYLAPSDKGIRPLCWDSETHHLLSNHKPYKRNVLFSDGHVESLYEKEFFQLMKKYGISNPNNSFPEYEPAPVPSQSIEPVPHQELLAVLENTDLSEIEKLRENFYKYPIQLQLETIAYTLSQGIYSAKTIRLMTGNRDLLNTSFARFFPKNIRNLEGRPLYDAVNIINTVFPPDPSFIPVLLDYAIESDYVASYNKSAQTGREPIVFSVFITTSQALYKISDKKIGMRTLPWDWFEIRDKEKIIKQWRDTYEKSIKPDLIKKGIISE